MSNNPTTLAPVSDISIVSTAHNPFRLTDEVRESLIEVFCAAAHEHKREYLQRKQWLLEHLAKEERDEKHDAVLISLCDFTESYLRNTAQTYKLLMGSNFWIDEVNKIIQEASQDA